MWVEGIQILRLPMGIKPKYDRTGLYSIRQVLIDDGRNFVHALVPAERDRCLKLSTAETRQPTDGLHMHVLRQDQVLELVEKNQVESMFFPDGDTLGRVDNQIPQWLFVGSCEKYFVHRAMNVDITRLEHIAIEVHFFL